MSAQRKICVVTGTRAEYGLLRHLMKSIQEADRFALQVIATGMHLSEKFGFTYRDIEEDGFAIDRKIDLNLVSDTPVGISQSTALGVTGFAAAFDALAPDLVLVLGDRYEILSAAIAAVFARIPIAHLHGGELTEGVIDESIRHAVTKFSHLHFVANEEYRNRVIQLGEKPSTVFNVGGLGVDAIKRLTLLGRGELETSLGIKFKKKNLLITFHPVTLEKNTSRLHMSEVLDAVSGLEDTLLIFTMPNADTDGRVLFEMIEDFVSRNDHACVFTSLGQLRYLSCIAQVDAVVGNSSSGLAEVPSFKKATINIGDRQKGRMQAASVVNCLPKSSDIRQAISGIYDAAFQNKLAAVVNPYGDGGAVERIMKVLDETSFDGLIHKEFYDLDRR